MNDAKMNYLDLLAQLHHNGLISNSQLLKEIRNNIIDVDYYDYLNFREKIKDRMGI